MKVLAYDINESEEGRKIAEYVSLDELLEKSDALNSGKVYAAGLDVVSTEPIRSGNPLLNAKNCFITPHISWASKEARQRIMDMTYENIKAFIDGDPINVVN